MVPAPWPHQGDTTMSATRSGPAPGGSLSHKMLLLASMYLCQAIPMGYVFGCMPVIMRQNHMSLASIGGLFVLHLPWAFKFIHASWVDSHYLPALGRRRSWIFPLQWVGACLLLVAAHMPPETDFTAMFVVLLLLNMVMATNDIAVDGYATDILEPHERSWGNTVQAGARYVGMMLGGGLMLVLHDSFGWQTLCHILAATVFGLSLPVFLHREIPSLYERHDSQKHERTGLRAFVRRPGVLWLLPVLIGPTAFAFSSFQMRMPLFVDLGMTGPVMGKLMMRFAYPAGLAGTIASGWLLHRFGPRLFLRVFCLTVAGLAAYTVLIAGAHSIAPWKTALVLSLDNILMGGINVWGFTLMMRACAGHDSGTGFALLSSLFILVPLATAPLFGMVGDTIGFEALYLLLGLLSLAGFALAEWAMRRGDSQHGLGLSRMLRFVSGGNV
ncbi:MFS transporter [Pseudodesulfovibrio senegalensis]|uniref:MFS transporter n=2 Tax=Pseudodesulfovibrio senegalensis TaxID=1721087 RepID=A0A6N6N335_9BACT|nr:MFS transporter [Pseudodesulfovibrio senegalensis]